MNQTLSKLSPNTMPPSPQKDDSSDIIDLGQLVRAIWRGKWLITLLVVLGILGGWYYANRMAVPLYRAKSVIVLEPQGESSAAGLASVVQGLSGDPTALNTEVQVLQGRMLVGRLVDRLNLTEDPEFNPSLRPPSLVDGITASIRNVLGGNAGTAASDPQRVRDRAIDILLSRLDITILPLTRVFELTAESWGAEKSAQIVDTLAELYIDSQLREKFEAAEEATAWLTARVTDLQAELEQAETRLSAFSAQTDLIDQTTLIAMEVQLKDLRDRAQGVRATLENERNRLEALNAAGNVEETLDAAGDERLRTLAADLGAPGGQEAYENRLEQVVANIRQNIARAESQAGTLTASANRLADQIAAQSQDLIELQQLQREAEATRLLYEYFLSRLKETSVQQGIQQADSRVLSNAVTPGAAASPNKDLAIIMGALLGFLIGAIFVLFRELTGETFRTSGQLEHFTGRSVMGQIPLIPQRARRNVIGYLHDKPTSAAAEAIRNLRTSVLMSNLDNPPQVIALTSSVPGEGKTTVSLALAQNFTGLGKKVLLIEGDIRRRVFSEYLKIENPVGLLAVLSGTHDVEDVVIRDPAIGADILIGEQSNVNAADIFSSEKFERTLQDLRQRYDVILIDTPPVLVVPDARVVADQADALLFVVRWDHTPKSQVQESIRMFSSANQVISGFVLNQISERGMRAYGYGGKYGAYSEYGKKYYNN